VIRAYRAVVGAKEGNIIAAIITNHTPQNQPSVPRSVPGPASIPAICLAVSHQAAAASASSSNTRPRRERTALSGRVADGCRCRHADHENWDLENAALPSYSIPKASILERVA